MESKVTFDLYPLPPFFFFLFPDPKNDLICDSKNVIWSELWVLWSVAPITPMDIAITITRINTNLFTFIAASNIAVFHMSYICCTAESIYIEVILCQVIFITGFSTYNVRSVYDNFLHFNFFAKLLYIVTNSQNIQSWKCSDQTERIRELLKINFEQGYAERHVPHTQAETDQHLTNFPHVIFSSYGV